MDLPNRTVLPTFVASTSFATFGTTATALESFARLARPNQVHLAYRASNEMLVTWVTGDSNRHRKSNGGSGRGITRIPPVVRQHILCSNDVQCAGKYHRPHKIYRPRPFPPCRADGPSLEFNDLAMLWETMSTAGTKRNHFALAFQLTKIL